VVLALSAQGQHGAESVKYSVAARQAARDLAALGAGGNVQDKADDPLRSALQSLSAEVGAGMKGLEGKIAELVRRQEELVDQLAFQSSDKEPAMPSEAGARKRPFGFLTMSYCESLARFLGQEHPQLVALLLSYLEPGLAACVLEAIPQEMRTDVTERICTISRVSPEVLREVERILEKKLSSVAAEEGVAAGGVAAVVEILNVATRGLEKFVVESMEKSNPHLAEEIKKRMFVFEDIVLLAKESLATVLAAVPRDDLLLSLKAVSSKVRDYVWECLPGPTAAALQAALEKAGPARLFDVNAAQQRVVGIIRVMEEEGKIVVAREGELVQ
jgi:flagellar motor switch protein FliG